MAASRKLYVCRQHCTLTDSFKKAMQCVPQPVVVVTTAAQDEKNEKFIRRGVTVSSFASISLTPPLVSFCLSNNSRMHSLLMRSHHFVAHILGKDHIHYGVHFAKATPMDSSYDQFEGIKIDEGIHQTPILKGAIALLQCRTKSVHDLGDHHVWFGDVLKAEYSDTIVDSLVYYRRSYRSIGDELFMKAFEECFLPFEEWTHEAHLRMAWNYITEHGKEAATPLIKRGITLFNEQNKHRITYGYNETVTMFYIHMVDMAIKSTLPQMGTFEEFLAANKSLTQSSLLFVYYSRDVISSPLAKSTFILPNLCSLP